ncbi:uncharacterized protein [Ambystoma mexicanum]|uniref:uncharacterized protein n=1 Tax=Ambystoma mexicanum TaxID=8296 RepID=UPI0037E888E9
MTSVGMWRVFAPSDPMTPFSEANMQPCNSAENPCQKIAEYIVLALGMAVGLVIGINISSLVWCRIAIYLKSVGRRVPAPDNNLDHKMGQTGCSKVVTNDAGDPAFADPPAKQRSAPVNLILEISNNTRQERAKRGNGTGRSPAQGAKTMAHIPGKGDEKAARHHLAGRRDERRHLRHRNHKERVGQSTSGFFYKESHARAERHSSKVVVEDIAPSNQKCLGSMPQEYARRIDCPDARFFTDTEPQMNQLDRRAPNNPPDPGYCVNLTEPKHSVDLSNPRPQTARPETSLPTDQLDSKPQMNQTVYRIATYDHRPHMDHSELRASVKQSGLRSPINSSYQTIIDQSGPRPPMAQSDLHLQMNRPDCRPPLECIVLRSPKNQKEHLDLQPPSDQSDPRFKMEQSDIKSKMDRSNSNLQKDLLYARPTMGPSYHKPAMAWSDSRMTEEHLYPSSSISCFDQSSPMELSNQTCTINQTDHTPPMSKKDWSCTRLLIDASDTGHQRVLYQRTLMDQPNPRHLEDHTESGLRIDQNECRQHNGPSDDRVKQGPSDHRLKVDESGPRIRMDKAYSQQQIGWSDVRLQNNVSNPCLPLDQPGPNPTQYKSEPRVRIDQSGGRPQTDHMHPDTIGGLCNRDQGCFLNPGTTELTPESQRPLIHSNSACTFGEASHNASKASPTHHPTPNAFYSPRLHWSSLPSPATEPRARHHSEMTTAPCGHATSGNRTAFYECVAGEGYLQKCQFSEQSTGHVSNTPHFPNQQASASVCHTDTSIHSMNESMTARQNFADTRSHATINQPEPKTTSMQRHSLHAPDSSDTGAGRVVYDARSNRNQFTEQDESKSHEWSIQDKETAPIGRQRFFLYNDSLPSRERNPCTMASNLLPPINTRPRLAQVPKSRVSQIPVLRSYH